MPQNDIKALQSAIANGKVSHVRLLHASDTLLTRIAVSPQQLRSIATYSGDFKDGIKENFSPVLAGLKVNGGTGVADVRWGLIFTGTDGKEIGSIFVDKWGKAGYVNDEVVAFDTGFFERSLATRLREISQASK
ncbi:MAG TPA: hypothetical protein VHX60_14935 [Acidobacteriaceae bacterium]|jgi:hypothetical protein|nr:hypothetical protein [Acidobacteriaceae bacterium]